MNILSIILARGGSKSVPRKNVRLLGGIPLIAHTIKLSLQIPLITKTVVSSDDQEILQIGSQFGANVLKRPEHLATDEASSEAAINHVLDEMDKLNEKYDVLILLEPTSPFRSTESVIKAIEIFSSGNYTTLVSAIEDYSTFWTINNGIGSRLFPFQSRRRQERTPLYKEVGVIYMATVEHMKKNSSFISDNVFIHLVSEKEALDINSEADLEYAQNFINTNERY